MMATGSTSGSSDSSSVPAITTNKFRRHYSDLSKAIGPFPELLLSVSNGFYQHSFIDLQTKTDINRSSGLTGASMLLDHVMMKIEQSDLYLPLVMDILREEVGLTDIVHKMEESADDNQGSASALTNTTVTLSTNSPCNPVPSCDITVADTISAAERLKSAFDFLCFTLITVVSQAKVNLAWLRLQICLRLQYTRGNTPKVQGHLMELEECNKAESVVTYLVSRNFLGYLNFDLLEAFKPVLSSDKFNEELEEYQLAHKQFIMNNFHNMVEAFRLNEDLRPASIVGLPKIKVELATPWKSKSLYYWKELVNDIVDWGPYIVITRVEFNCVSITYQVLPFIIPRVVKDLTNRTIVKRFTAIGATFTIPDELVQDGIADNQWIMNTIHEQILLKKTTRSNEEGDDPVTNEANETIDQPLEELEVRPKLPLNPSKMAEPSTEEDDVQKDYLGEAIANSSPPPVSNHLKVLITGGCGFLGRHIGHYVYREFPPDTEIALLDNDTASFQACQQVICQGKDDVRRIRVKSTDITNYENLLKVFKAFRPNLVFHCAALVDFSATITDDLICNRMRSINVHGTQNVVEACKNTGVQALVYTGALAQVLPKFSKAKLIINETTPLPEDLLTHSYGQTKGEGEKYVLNAARNSNTFKACSIRCPPLYGVFDKEYIPNVMLTAQRYFNRYPRCGDPGYTMSTMYVKNAAYAHVCAAKKLLDQREDVFETVNGEFFYIGDNTPPKSAFEFHMSFLRELGIKPLPSKIPEIVFTIFFYVFVAVILFFHAFFDNNFPSPILNYRWQLKTLSVNHEVQWNKARETLGYIPPVDYDTAFEKSLHFYYKWH